MKHAAWPRCLALHPELEVDMTCSRFSALALSVSVITACDSVGPEDGSRVTVRFAAISASTRGADLAMSASGEHELVITGSNGTLTITDVAFIVSELELERARDGCGERRDRVSDDDDDGGDRDDDDGDCESLEVGPFFVDLEFGDAVVVVSREVAAGSYTGLEFEVEDLRRDEDDDESRGRRIPELGAEIRAAGFDEWPDAANMVVAGSFTPRNGAARPFTVYFDADIEIELEFEPALIVGDDERSVDVEIDPTFWFRTFANTVVDLSEFDFAVTRRIVDFEAKLEGGFQRIEFDD
jgi:hypothetical protein